MKESVVLVSFLALVLCINVESRGIGNNSSGSDIGEINEHSTIDNRVESNETSDQINAEKDNSLNKASVFTVSTKIELGAPLMVATPFGCAILAQPSDKQVSSSDNQAQPETDPLPNVKGEWLSFDFTLSDLSDCAEVTDAILSQLRHQLLSQYPSTTTESPISLHSTSQDASNDENMNISPATNERDVEFREKLSVTMHPTTLDSVYVLRFSLLDEPHPLAESNIIKALSAINGESDKPLLNESNQASDSQDLGNMSGMDSAGINKEIDLSKKILEELSSSKSESVECMSLAPTEKDCKSYSKCDVLRLDGKNVCFVSPRTAFWLLDTQCALQSKSALLAVAKDLTSAGMLTEENYQALRSSFDVNHICSTITHSYFANSKRLSPIVPPKAFEL